jgi:integrase/recombinase XerD
MQNLIEKYRTHLFVRNYAKRSIEGLLSYLTCFIAWLADKDITDVADITKDLIRDYQASLFEEINSRGQPNTVHYQNTKLQAVKSFLMFLAENDYLPTDPSRTIAYAREPKRLPRSILTPIEARKLLHTPDTKTALGYRDRTILEVLYSSGIRKEELLNLLLTDVDYHDGFLRINAGKGNKDRVVPIGRIACRYLENYVKAVRPTFIRNPYENHLFLSLRGNKLSKNVVWEVVKRSTRKAKIKKTVSPHTFRHTCATLMLRNNANIRHIQDLLGHASLDSTQVYAHVSITDLKEVHKRCHPRERDKD